MPPTHRAVRRAGEERRRYTDHARVTRRRRSGTGGAAVAHTSRIDRALSPIRTMTVGLRITLSPPVTGCHRVAGLPSSTIGLRAAHRRFGISPNPASALVGMYPSVPRPPVRRTARPHGANRGVGHTPAATVTDRYAGPPPRTTRAGSWPRSSSRWRRRSAPSGRCRPAGSTVPPRPRRSPGPRP